MCPVTRRVQVMEEMRYIPGVQLYSSVCTLDLILQQRVSLTQVVQHEPWQRRVQIRRTEVHTKGSPVQHNLCLGSNIAAVFVPDTGGTTCALAKKSTGYG